MVLIKAERVADIVLRGESIAAAIGETDSFAEKEARSTFTPVQKRLYQIWKLNCTMPQEMIWCNKRIQTLFSRPEDSDEELPKKRARKNENKENDDDLQDLNDFWERNALGELFKLPSTHFHLISSKDVVYFKTSFPPLCPLLEAMVIIIRTKNGLGKITEELTKMRQEREFESSRQVLDALVSQKRMIKSKVDAHFEKLERNAGIIRERVRTSDPQWQEAKQIEPTGEGSFPGNASESRTVEEPQSDDSPSLERDCTRGAVTSNGIHDSEDGRNASHSHVNAQEDADIATSDQSVALNGLQTSQTPDAAMKDVHRTIETDAANTQCESIQSDPYDGLRRANGDGHLVHRVEKVLTPPNGRLEAVTTLDQVSAQAVSKPPIAIAAPEQAPAQPPSSTPGQPQARSQASPHLPSREYSQTESGDWLQGQDQKTEQPNPMLPSHFDLDSMLPPDMRVDPTVRAEKNVRASSVEVVQQVLPHPQGSQMYERGQTDSGQTAPGQRNEQLGQGEPPSTSLPNSFIRSIHTPPFSLPPDLSWSNVFKVSGKTNVPGISSPRAASPRQSQPMPRSILKKTSVTWPIGIINFDDPILSSQPASIAEIGQRDDQIEYNHDTSQAVQSSPNSNQHQIESITQNKQMPFTSHKMMSVFDYPFTSSK